MKRLIIGYNNMGNYSKQYSIYLSEFLLCIAYTIIAPFYPGVAESKGLPIWLIGIIFSIDPLVGLPTSMIVGRYMRIFGRRNVLVFGMAAGTLGMFCLGLVELYDYTTVIILSIISRTLAGIGAGCALTAGEAILASGYPDEIEVVIGRLEVSSGLGFLMGPIIGSLLSYFTIFTSFTCISVMFLVFTPLSYFMIGECDAYTENHTCNISLIKLAFKPVSFR